MVPQFQPNLRTSRTAAKVRAGRPHTLGRPIELAAADRNLVEAPPSDDGGQGVGSKLGGNRIEVVTVHGCHVEASKLRRTADHVNGARRNARPR